MDAVAKETLQILDQGWYTVDCSRVSIARAQRNAVEGTILFRPEDLEKLAQSKMPRSPASKTRFSVTNETTQKASRRLVQDEGVEDLAVLNFASARKVGGGFLRGAKAQEEDIARSSGLVRCLETQPDFYKANQSTSSSLYTDHIIYSPAVPWFRSEDGRLLSRPFLASIISAPAPNANEFFKKIGADRGNLQDTLKRRIGRIMEVVLSRGNRALLLGAWGCGVFENDPDQVAATFMSQLKKRRFSNRFDQVVFAVHDPSDSGTTIEAFRKRVR